jgi:PAP2 superfamily
MECLAHILNLWPSLPSMLPYIYCTGIFVIGLGLIIRTQKIPLLLRLAQSTTVIIGASLVCLSRIYLRYHTPLQVLCGVLIGATLGVAWYMFVILLRAVGFVDWLLHVWFVEMLWFKDGDIGSLEHDLREEWMEWRISQELERSKQNGSKLKST